MDGKEVINPCSRLLYSLAWSQWGALSQNANIFQVI